MNGFNLKLSRIKARVTGRVLARKLKISPSALCMLESREHVPQSKAKAYLDALDKLKAKREHGAERKRQTL